MTKEQFAAELSKYTWEPIHPNEITGFPNDALVWWGWGYDMAITYRDGKYNFVLHEKPGQQPREHLLETLNALRFLVTGGNSLNLNSID